MGQVYLFGGAMRFLARDQVSNVLASRGHGTVLSAVLLRREKKSLIRASARPTDGDRGRKGERGQVLFSPREEETSRGGGSRAVTRGSRHLGQRARGRGEISPGPERNHRRARDPSQRTALISPCRLCYLFFCLAEKSIRPVMPGPTFFRDAIKFTPQPSLCREAKNRSSLRQRGCTFEFLGRVRIIGLSDRSRGGCRSDARRVGIAGV